MPVPNVRSSSRTAREAVADHVPGSATRTWRKACAAVRAGVDAARAFDAPPVTPRQQRQQLSRSRLGMVERIGHRQIAGWVADNETGLPARVTLWVNNLQVAATWAGEPADLRAFTPVRLFHFRLRDLWDYCSEDDKVTVRLDGVPLPIARLGTYAPPPRAGEHRVSDLRVRLREGYVFSQLGELQLSKQLDTQWQDAVFGLYGRVAEVLRARFGLDAFLIYGSLLGFVREGGFIGHDVDFDAAYLSRQTDPARAAEELRDVALALVDAGFDVVCKLTALHISDTDDADLRIDLFHTYFDGDELKLPFGTVGSEPFTRGQWTGITDAEFVGRTVKVPGSAQALAEHIYGPAWNVPVAGFNWKRERAVNHPEAFTRPEHQEEVYWANFYAHHSLADGSSFFEFVDARDDIPSTVLDIGCGDGRDAFAFARNGRRVHGIDRSHVGIRHAADHAAAAGLSEQLSFDALDVSDAQAVRATVTDLRERSGGGPILFYLRFFLHSIPEDVQQPLLQALADEAHEGDVLAAEFRTQADADAEKVYGGHYRRYQDGPEFGRALRDDLGFGDLRFEIESAGLAPYKDEDPVLYRAVAAFTPRS